MGFRTQTPRGIVQLVDQFREISECALGIGVVVAAVVVRRSIDLEGTGWLQDRSLQHRLPGIQPADLLGRLDLDETQAKQAPTE